MKSNFLVTDRTQIMNDQKKNPPTKPPRAFTLTSLQVKPVERNDNSENSLQETILTNNVHFETFANDDCLRLYIYYVKQLNIQTTQKNKKKYLND